MGGGGGGGGGGGRGGGGWPHTRVCVFIKPDPSLISKVDVRVSYPLTFVCVCVYSNTYGVYGMLFVPKLSQRPLYKHRTTTRPQRCALHLLVRVRRISDLPYIHLYISETTACAACNFWLTVYPFIHI